MKGQPQWNPLRRGPALPVVIVLALVLIGGCTSASAGPPGSSARADPPGSPAPAGPLESLAAGGQPVVDGTGAAVLPGQVVVATAFVVNTSHAPARLVAAALVPIEGRPVPGLAHVAVNVNHDYDLGGTSWPPDVPIRPLSGAQIGRDPVGIVFGVIGYTADRNYMAAGLKISYVFRGGRYTMTAWS